MVLFFFCSFTLISFFFIFIGVSVVLNKKPLLLNTKYIFAIMVFFLLPLLVMIQDMASTGISPGLVTLVSIIFVSSLVFSWIQMNGYTAIGVSNDSLRTALHYSLKKNNLNFEEQLSVIKLTGIDATLKIEINSWNGVAKLKFEKNKDSSNLQKIIGGIDEYYKNNVIPPNYITSILYISFGLMMLISSGYFYFDHP